MAFKAFIRGFAVWFVVGLLAMAIDPAGTEGKYAPWISLGGLLLGVAYARSWYQKNRH